MSFSYQFYFLGNGNWDNITIFTKINRGTNIDNKIKFISTGWNHTIMISILFIFVYYVIYIYIIISNIVYYFLFVFILYYYIIYILFLFLLLLFFK